MDHGLDTTVGYYGDVDYTGNSFSGTVRPAVDQSFQVAGGPDSGSDLAHLAGPGGIDVGGAGVVFIADTGNDRVLAALPDGLTAGDWTGG